MVNFVTINKWSFVFTKHSHCKNIHHALNYTYLEQIATTAITPVFTNATPPTVATNAIAAIRNTVIKTILLTSTADCTIIAPIINSMFLLDNFLFGNMLSSLLLPSIQRWLPLSPTIRLVLFSKSIQHLFLLTGTGLLWLISLVSLSLSLSLSELLSGE